MIRLLLLIPTLDRSGAEKQLMLLARGLPTDEFSVHVVALTRGGPYADVLRQAGIDVTVLGKRMKFDPRTLRDLRRLVREERPDVIHSWLFAANAYARFVAGGANGPPVVVSERCVDSWKSGWQLWLDRRLVSRTRMLLANSESVAEFYRGVGHPAERVMVIPNGIEEPPSPSCSREELLRELSLPDDARLVAYVGRLAPQKRLDTLLWAAQLLRQANERSYLLIAGDGPQAAWAKELSRKLECDRHVRFLGHRDDAASLLPLVDAFWLASDFEGMSNSLMEAMACGRPVVVSNIPPNRELVDHGVEGYLVDVGDGVGLAQYTARLLDDPDLAAKMGEAGRRRMQEHHSVAQMVSRHAELYHRLLAPAAEGQSGTEDAAVGTSQK
ncbi:Putative glycosyltransferase EpsD [Maioricimonas rarisocia]|uniref:Glycosyltransferase EpsD n=1 Tax=Maioricimonas rarisocia TaxID=2528026 RepID=A0A517Z334_9PLAN|nr:Putative glycosyltransferase EpsD [Maioricimonas rarisocia]